MKNILNATKSVKWCELGVQLDFEASRLEIIDEDHPNNAERAKIKLVSEWLKNDREDRFNTLSEIDSVCTCWFLNVVVLVC